MVVVALAAIASNAMMAYWIHRTIEEDGWPEDWGGRLQAATVIVANCSAVALALGALF